MNDLIIHLKELLKGSSKAWGNPGQIYKANGPKTNLRPTPEETQTILFAYIYCYNTLIDIWACPWQQLGSTQRSPRGLGWREKGIWSGLPKTIFM